MKICTKCKIEKDESYFILRKDIDKYRNECKNCLKLYQQEYYSENKEQIDKNNKKYNEENKEQMVEYHKEYYLENRKRKLEYQKEYQKVNKEQRNKYEKERRKFDFFLKLRINVSNSINHGLKYNNGSKRGKSIQNYLEYTFEIFKQYLESLFEPWMNWNNWGKYNLKTWDDNDSSTWTWQLDHIIPHSTFNYDSLEHPDFKKCWALSNLRPYSAKQNVLDGNRR